MTATADICGAEEPIPPQIVEIYQAVCNRDLSGVKVQCQRPPHPAYPWHWGRALDLGDFQWADDSPLTP